MDRGITAEYQARFAAIQMVDACGYHMIGRNGGYSAPIQYDSLAQFHRLITHEGVFRVGYPGEVRPDFPVEYMLFENIQRFFSGGHSQGAITHEPDAIHHERNAGDMIKMRVRDKNMIDHVELGQAEFAGPRTCVNQHVLIEQERGGAQIATDSAAAT